MTGENLTCARCGTELSPNFQGKAKARNWDAEKLTCSEHFNEVEGARLIPKA